MNGLRGLLPNAWYVAIREFKGRVSTRSFVIGTILLAAIAFAAAEAPVIVDALVSGSQTKLAIVVEPAAENVPADVRSTLDDALNARADGSSTGTDAFSLTWYAAADASTAEDALKSGGVAGLLTVDRDPATQDLAFTLKTDLPSDGREVQGIYRALATIVVEDRLVRAGLPPDTTQRAFEFSLQPATPGSAASNNISGEISSNLLSTGLIVMIFMAIITYGTWVAMSVAEEKGSRVMELMLNAATPLQMLAGKVVGNGAAGLAQYAVVLAAGVAGVLSQGEVSGFIKGSGGSAPNLGGLTASVLVGFALLFVLGFTFYSLLYAALGSLVSRQEDVQSATSPLMMLIMVGYFMSVFALNAIDEPWVKVASFVPFFSPYLMLARIAAGSVAVWEVGLAAAILVVSVGMALVFAARVYSAGVLLYGQRVGIREVLKAARVER